MQKLDVNFRLPGIQYFEIRTRESRQDNLKNMLNASSENNLSATIRTLCLESVGVSEQTLANYSGGVSLIISVDIVHRELTQCV